VHYTYTSIKNDGCELNESVKALSLVAGKVIHSP
jgi:hypothetical protein